MAWARPPHPLPQDWPTTASRPASFQPRLGLSARDLSRTLVKVSLPTPEGYLWDGAASGPRAWPPGTPPLRLPFKHSSPGQSSSRVARHSNRGGAGLQAGKRRKQALRTNSRPHSERPDCTSAPRKPAPPPPWVPVGPSRPGRAYPNLPPTAPPSWRRSEGALLPQGGPRAEGSARVDA